MEPLVSVIVPVYQTEKYLTRCFDSLIRQSLQNIEVILIDDGSTDLSGKICDDYAAKDFRFKYYRQPHKGVAVARNYGIHKAIAKYLMFVDSDDWVADDFCEVAYQCAVKNEADIVMFGLQRVKKTFFTESFSKYCFLKDNKINKKSCKNCESVEDSLDMLFYVYGGGPCNKLYNRKLFFDVLFPDGYMYEDVGIMYKLVFKAKKVCCIDNILYNYCFRPESTTNMMTEKSLKDRSVLQLQRYQDLIDWGYPTEKLNKLIKRNALDYCIKKKPDASDPYYTFFKDVLHNCRFSKTDLTWRRNVMLLLFKYCMPLFEFICTLKSKKIC